MSASLGTDVEKRIKILSIHQGIRSLARIAETYKTQLELLAHTNDELYFFGDG
jgi:hypothetical protein